MSDTALRPARFRYGAVLPGWIGLAVVVFWLAVALLAPIIAPHPAGAILRVGTLAPASAAAPFGTDFLGRDMLSRVIYGARYTVGLSLLAAICASAIGSVLGILAAVRGGWTDGVLSRTSDALISLPHLMFALVIVAALGSSLPVLVGLVAFSYIPGAFRIARSLAANVNAMDFIQVARARGEGTPYIVLHEILPNILLPVLTDFGLRFVFSVLLLSGLSFLGLGVQPPNADLGALVRENIEGIYDAAPAVIVPAIAIATLTIAVNLAIDGLLGRSRLTD
ncbi:ABC transporter permease [Acidisphaera sp. L21]|uniref:ABC transporter permease n=1 Tax=Acidisphaera sp. L21 TaxID=1641851 RepID=UPI00131D4A44|nr:ABC transporter permease [Acidisphaera sp. L21]